MFRPSDIGAPHATLAEAVLQAVERCPRELHCLLYETVLVTGGTSLFNNFVQRLQQDLRPLVPEEMNLNVTHMPDPKLAAWQGGNVLAKRNDLGNICVTSKTMLSLESRLNNFFISL